MWQRPLIKPQSSIVKVYIATRHRLRLIKRISKAQTSASRAAVRPPRGWAHAHARTCQEWIWRWYRYQCLSLVGRRPLPTRIPSQASGKYNCRPLILPKRERVITFAIVIFKMLLCRRSSDEFRNLCPPHGKGMVIGILTVHVALPHWILHFIIPRRCTPLRGDKTHCGFNNSPASHVPKFPNGKLKQMWRLIQHTYTHTRRCVERTRSRWQLVRPAVIKMRAFK